MSRKPPNGTPFCFANTTKKSLPISTPSYRAKWNYLAFHKTLFHEVLHYALVFRGVMRALRLKLVCGRYRSLRQTFNELKTTGYFYKKPPVRFFESRLLDEFMTEPRYSSLKFMVSWYIRKNYGAEKLWHSYHGYRA